MTHPGGAPRKIESPKELYDLFEDYKRWVNGHPVYRNDFIRTGQNAGEIVQIPCNRPLTEWGFAAHIGMSRQGLINYGRAEGYEEYFDTYARIRTEMTDQVLVGAINELYNPNLVAKIEGIHDKTHIEHSGSLDIGAELAAARARKQDESI